MALYQLVSGGVKTSDLFIPNDPANRHWREFLDWQAAGNIPDPQFTQAELDAQAAAIAAESLDREDRAAAKADPLIANLAGKTPAQIDAYIVANVTDLASAKLVLRGLAQVVGILARKL